ncbi:hypothetical protein ACHAWU_007798, partial [Discostella pseudostelligera]
MAHAISAVESHSIDHRPPTTIAIIQLALPSMMEVIDSSDSEAEAPKPLTTIWDCPNVRKINGGWECGYCPPASNFFKGENATKALYHVLKIKGHNVRPCDGCIPPQYANAYTDLHLRNNAASETRQQKKSAMNKVIGDIQSRTVAAIGGGVVVVPTLPAYEPGISLLSSTPSSLSSATASSSIKKRTSSSSYGGTISGWAAAASHQSNHAPQKKFKGGESKPASSQLQLKLYGASTYDPSAAGRLNVAIADFLHSNCLSFSLAECPKLKAIITLAKNVHKDYKPPTRQAIGGPFLDSLFESYWNQQMKSLLLESDIFGVTVFGDGATIQKVPLVNVMAAGVHNPSALLDIEDCTDHLAKGGKKDARYLALEVAKPIITRLDLENPDGMASGAVDLIMFDGASNVQNAGRILNALDPRITVGHGAEHVVSLLFADCYSKIDAFKLLSSFSKRCRDIWGNVRHSPHAMFTAYSKQHNNGINLGFVKPSECRMAGEHIALLRLLRLKNALRSTIASKEFMDLKQFKAEATILSSDAFWKYLFVMCRALYAPMRILRLADQKTPAMDKLYYYVLQTDRQLPNEADKWSGDSVTHQVMRFWLRRRENLVHDYSLVGYILSPNPIIMEDAAKNKSKDHMNAAKRLIIKLFIDPTLTGTERTNAIAKMYNTFLE